MYQATILKAYGREYFFCFHFLMWKNGGIIMHGWLKSEKNAIQGSRNAGNQSCLWLLKNNQKLKET